MSDNIQKPAYILLHITGNDSAGILAQITGQLNQSGAEIVDLQQTTTLGQLSLSVLVKISSDTGLSLIQDILFLTRSQKLYTTFQILNNEQINIGFDQKRYAITVLSKQFETASFHALTQVLADHSVNIDRMNFIAKGSLTSLELMVSMQKSLNLDEIKKALFRCAFEHTFDLAMQRENLYRKSKRLIVIDMDSTLIQQEVIDEIADFAGVKDKVAEITERAMRGELDFTSSLTERVSLLKGLPVENLTNVLERIQLTPGVENLVSILKKLGFKLAVISGGFTFFTSHFEKKLGLDYSFANTLEVENNKLTGRVTGDIVDRKRKGEILKELARQQGIPLDQTVAVGDGANDLDMLGIAGLGIAFNAKPAVRSQSAAFVNQLSLDAILYILGVSEKEVQEMQSEND